MVNSKITSRLPSIKAKVILTQTDTTVGFVSQSERQLISIKARQNTKPFLKVYANHKEFLACGNRIPHAKKNLVRRSKKTSFIVKNRAFRVAKYQLHSQVLRDLSWSFSTSANESGKHFDREFCEDKADIIIEDKNSLTQFSASTLILLGKTKQRRVR